MTGRQISAALLFLYGLVDLYVPRSPDPMAITFLEKAAHVYSLAFPALAILYALHLLNSDDDRKK